MLQMTVHNSSLRNKECVWGYCEIAEESNNGKLCCMEFIRIAAALENRAAEWLGPTAYTENTDNEELLTTLFRICMDLQPARRPLHDS